MPLLAYEGTLSLKPCCAKPANACRKPTWKDIYAWMKTHPEAEEQAQNAKAKGLAGDGDGATC